MKRAWTGLLVLLIGSEIIGVLFGHIFFGLFNKTVPPAVLTSFNKGTAYGAFLVYGMGAGVLIFLWELLGIYASRFFRGGKQMESTPGV